MISYLGDGLGVISHLGVGSFLDTPLKAEWGLVF